jgi:hypothetical protein
MKKPTVALVAILAALSACTPEQLDTVERLTGYDYSQSQRDALLPLPDDPAVVGTKLVHPDGSVTDSPQAVVNATVYNWGDPGPALQAFRLVAAARGWTQAQTASWETAIVDIMAGESGFCPNLLGGSRVANGGVGCVISSHGSGSDAGFGQLIGIHHTITTAGTGWLCRQEGICGRWAVIATPWSSMTALVALIERSGVSGWCFADWARAYHRTACSNPGLDV